MLQGHGDDTYIYPGIRSNFSSNIYPHADLTGLKAHLCGKMDLINHYPEPEPRSLEMAIARRYGISVDNVLVTNGATDAIYLIAQTVAKNSYHHYDVGPLPTFSEYEDACRMFGLTQRNDLVETEMTGHTVLWFCNPNNPTGNVYSKEVLTDFAQKYRLVVIDQSYEDYTLAPMMTHQEAATSKNIVQLHSLTKTYAIPGLRIGYIVAPQHIIAMLRDNIRPWAVNALAVEAGKWLLENNVSVVHDLYAYLAETQRLRTMLNQITGITTAETQTNFILSEMASKTAADLKDYLAKTHHILIRDASNFRGLSPRHFRVSTQSPEENNLLVNAIREFMNQ
ncbi:MAG: pyridoxal phosphate-dependent class II aminotransferase [Prevotella sp.]|nr:pyridoxal phosphate-dependent class II aminotransferase [Prevotella sp.]